MPAGKRSLPPSQQCSGCLGGCPVGSAVNEKKEMEAIILQQELKVVNIGLRQFLEALEEQKTPVVHVDWKPPTEEDEEVTKLLESLL